MSKSSKSLPRTLAYASMAIAALGAALSLIPGMGRFSTFALAPAVGLTIAAAWMLGVRQDEAEQDNSLRRELAVNASSLVLLVVFLFLGFAEILAIPAALGHLVVFSQLGVGLVALYPVMIAGLLCALTGAVLLASSGTPPRPMRDAERALGHVSAGLTGLFLVGSLVVGSGAFESAGLKAERSVFVLAAALVTLFFFVKFWLRMPAYTEVSEWLERDERIKESGLLRKLIYTLLGVAAIGVVLSIVPALGIAPAGLGIFGMGVAMISLLAATFNVGVSHVVPQLELGMENAADLRKKRRVILSAISISLTVLSLAIALLTGLAFLAQAAGVTLFRFLLDAFVDYYVGIFAVAMIPLAVAVAVRTRVQTEVAYTPKLKALAIAGASLTIFLVFFGVFVGSGLAEGSGIQIENAVLIMGAAVLSLILFVKARTLLPGVIGLIREAVATSAQADKSQQESIKQRMLATYVVALVFVLGFAGFVVATSLGVIDAPTSSLGTDLGFFLYILLGIAVLVVVAMRYFQSVNIDQRWAKKQEEGSIGKKRLTADQVKRYLILGFSLGAAVLLFLVGLLIQFGAISAIGPLETNRRFATDFFVAAILIGIGPYGWYAAREARRTEAIDQKFPEFLRDLAESQRAGMTLTEAVLTASKGQYGMLTPEIRKMAAQIEWGVSFSDALERFAKRVNTPLIGRTVSLVIQASNAGGNVVDVLTAAADDSREIQQIVKERTQSMSIYVMIIYIAFAVFIGVIAVLNAQFIPEVAKAVEKADGVSIGGLNFRKFDQDDFKILFFHAAVIQGLGGGIVGGVMSQGKMVHGLRHSFILVAIAWVLFRLVIG